MPSTLVSGTGTASEAAAPSDHKPERTARRAWRRGLVARLRLIALSGTALAAVSSTAAAGLFDGSSGDAGAPGAIDAFATIQLAIFFGIVGTAILSAMWLIRDRSRMAEENANLRGRVADLNAALQRSESLLNLKNWKLIVWAGKNERPELIGNLPANSGAPEDRSGFLAFGRWLTAHSATALEHAIVGLRDKGRPFDLVCETVTGALLEISGQTSSQHSVVRLSSLTADREEHGRLRIQFESMMSAYETLRGLTDVATAPIWVRDIDGRLSWVNDAYAKAVEAESAQQAVEEGRELLPSLARDALRRHQQGDPVYHKKVSSVIAGDRHLFEVTDRQGEYGSAGIAFDITEIEALREEYEQAQRSHADTLDQLTTAVAIFDAEQKLRFHNLAFQKLWDLDTAFLSSEPDNALVLDRLRADGMLAEQPEWRRWKENLLAAYRSPESQEHWWHLPDGRTLRVVANPQPKGGVTWVFENLTEQIDLESRYKTAVRVQGETLDNLAEGVVVFGPDGRLRLANPAFANLWGLPEELTQDNVHISAIRAACDPVTRDSPWPGFVSLVTGFDEQRDESRGQVELSDGMILGYTTVPLPNGQVMLTFVDVTDSSRIERALKDKFEALQRADQLKNDFVQHVSYELRSPLTNIIGFTDLLNMESIGPLNDKQREYVDHIGTSSSVLLTIVNDILDLATVDAGFMELDVSEIAIAETVDAAVDLVAERMREHGIVLELDLADAPKRFQADEHRVRQILFKLLSNAVNYAPDGSTITLAVAARAGDIVFKVHDDGPGMPAEILETVFQRFSPGANPGRQRGAGLGLAIVKSFVELHGGSVDIETGEGKGTTVTCRFPTVPEKFRVAAE